MNLANRPLPWWLGPVLLAIVAADLAVGVFAHRAVPTMLVVLPVLLATVIALDSVGNASKRRLQAMVQPARVFTVAVDGATATRLGDLGEGSLLHERALLVVKPAALEFWSEESDSTRVLVIAWERLVGATVESHDVRKLHTISLEVPGADPLILDVVRPLHERLRRRAATAAELAAELGAHMLSVKAG
jgi:hypothetical protein